MIIDVKCRTVLIFTYLGKIVNIWYVLVSTNVGKEEN